MCSGAHWSGMDNNKIPVVVRMHVECDRCGHQEDKTCELDRPIVKTEALEAYQPGMCPECGAPIQMRLKRWQRIQ